ncbi:hypothetical protein JNW88_06555, partial [Micromonospora sp. ATA32]|nr:hypothetical protein [Micromonospora sp. ATA32]
EVDRLVSLGATRLEVGEDGAVVLADPDGNEFCAALPLLKKAIRSVAADTDLWTDGVWLVDSTPVECARSRPTVKRSQPAGWAGYS